MGYSMGRGLKEANKKWENMLSCSESELPDISSHVERFFTEVDLATFFFNSTSLLDGN